MRQLKFRAWYEPGKEMFSVDVLALSRCTWSCPDHGTRGLSLPFQPSIKVMQFTGLHDKNGKEIYEGDIFDYAGEFKDVVVFETGAFFFGEAHAFPSWDLNMSCVEVIGNIYENKELLNDL